MTNSIISPLGWRFQRCRRHEHCPRGLHRSWAQHNHVWGGFRIRLILVDHLRHLLIDYINHLANTCQVREVDSSSDPMFPGSDAGQELVLHTLEQIPEDERLQNTNTQIRFYICFSLVYFCTFLYISWICTYGISGHRISKAGAKKRRGRPPKFQISEIGEDGRKWYSCRWLLSSLFHPPNFENLYKKNLQCVWTEVWR